MIFIRTYNINIKNLRVSYELYQAHIEYNAIKYKYSSVYLIKMQFDNHSPLN